MLMCCVFLSSHVLHAAMVQSSRISSLIVYGRRDTQVLSFVNLSLFTQKLRRTLICDHQLQILEEGVLNQILSCWTPDTVVRALYHPWLMLTWSLQ